MYKLKIASKRLNTNESYLEHLKIFEALEAGESEIAEQAMRNHIKRGMEAFLLKKE
jgi:DNA-binding GntR family transcriptional regulator